MEWGIIPETPDYGALSEVQTFPRWIMDLKLLRRTLELFIRSLHKSIHWWPNTIYAGWIEVSCYFEVRISPSNAGIFYPTISAIYLIFFSWISLVQQYQSNERIHQLRYIHFFSAGNFEISPKYFYYEKNTFLGSS